MPRPTIKILRFTSDVCPTCDAMKRSKLLEKFLAIAEAHFDFSIHELSCVDENGKSPKPPAGDTTSHNYFAAFEKSDKYDVRGFPTIVFLSQDGVQLVKAEYNQFVSAALRKDLANVLVLAHAAYVERQANIADLDRFKIK